MKGTKAVSLTEIWNWTKRTAVASFVPCVAVAITIVSVVLFFYYAVAFLLLFGLYMLGMAVLLLVMRFGGWKIKFAEWVRR